MTSRNSSTHLLIIDPQNDFCDLPPGYCPTDPLTGLATQPALPVAGAHADMLRLASFIRAASHSIDDITITLDSHQHLDIAHVISTTEIANVCAVVPVRMTYEDAKGQWREEIAAGDDRPTTHVVDKP